MPLIYQRSAVLSVNSGPTRRRLLQGAAVATLCAGPWGAVLPQPASAAAEEAKAPPMPALGTELSVPGLTLFDGSVFDPALAHGHPLLVYWWASTCPFCALQSPSMEQLWQTQKSRGLHMVALSIDRKPADAQAYLKTKGYRFPAGWASPQWRQSFPKPRGLPITLLRGRDGRLLLAERGQMFAEDVLAMANLMG